MNQIRLSHRNLGHPNPQTMLRMFKDAGVPPEVLKQVEHFRCDQCLQRGRRATCHPATPPPNRNKWECISVDTFWWRIPKALLSEGPRGQHVEATDYRTIHVVRQGEKPQHSISGKEFREGFSESWIRRFPIPQKLI